MEGGSKDVWLVVNATLTPVFLSTHRRRRMWHEQDTNEFGMQADDKKLLDGVARTLNQAKAYAYAHWQRDAVGFIFGGTDNTRRDRGKKK